MIANTSADFVTSCALSVKVCWPDTVCGDTASVIAAISETHPIRPGAPRVRFSALHVLTSRWPPFAIHEQDAPRILAERQKQCPSPIPPPIVLPPFPHSMFWPPCSLAANVLSSVTKLHNLIVTACYGSPVRSISQRWCPEFGGNSGSASGHSIT